MSFRRHLHQIQGNWAGRNFATESRVNSRLIQYACKNAHRDESEIYNYQRFNFWIIHTLMVSYEVRLTWLDCNQRSYIWIFGWTLREDVRLACAQTPELFFDLFNCQRKNKNMIYANVYRNMINDGDSQTSPLPIFPEGVGTSVHRLSRICPFQHKTGL